MLKRKHNSNVVKRNIFKFELITWRTQAGMCSAMKRAE